MALAPGVANPQEYVGDTVAREQTSLWADAWRRLRRNRLALVATVFIGFVLLVAIISVFWTPYPIYRESVAPTYEGLSSQHLLGADQAGRDILSRLAVGAQISLEVGVGTQILVVAFGILVGLTAGYYRGILDGVISTVINIFYGIPSLLVALLMVLLLGRGLDKIIIAIAATSWMDMARLVRGQGLALREREFVEAARAGGAKASRIIFRHILPNALGPIVVSATLTIGIAIITESALSYLGLGIGPPIASWGSMLFHAQEFIWEAAHYALFPGVMILITVLCINFIGDGLRDAFDPRSFER